MKCLIIDDDEMIIATLQHYIAQTEGLECIGAFVSAVEALPTLKEEQVDILLLDVEMPDMSGMELMDVLNDMPNVILVTSKEEYAVKAFEYNVVDYLLKPVQYSRFLKSIDKVEQLIEGRSKEIVLTSNNELDVFIKSDLKYVKININEIFFIEAMADYVMFHMGPNKRHIVHSTMKALEAKLPNASFIRVHRSYIININKIESAENAHINVSDKKVPIGASYRTSFFNRLKLF